MSVSHNPHTHLAASAIAREYPNITNHRRSADILFDAVAHEIEAAAERGRLDPADIRRQLWLIAGGLAPICEEPNRG